MSRPQVYLRLLGYLRPYKLRFAVAVACTIVVGGLNAYPAYLVQYVINDLLIARRLDAVLFICASLVAVYLAKGAAAYWQHYCMYWVGQRIVMDVRNALHRHFIHLPLRFFEARTTGELIAKVIYDISLMQYAATNSVRDLLRHGITFVALLGVAIYQSPAMALIFIFIVPLVGFLVIKMGEKIRHITRRTQVRMGDMSSLMKETYAGIRVVKAFGAEEREEGRFASATRSFFDTVMRAMWVRSLAPPMVEIIGGILGAGVLWFGARAVILGGMDPGKLTSFAVALGMAYNPLKSFTRVFNSMMEGIAGAQSVFEMMDEHDHEDKNPRGETMGRLSGEIRFEAVHFSYGEEPVLENIDVAVPAGCTLAVVGMSGAGKSTLLDLIPRFYAPSRGRILFDGKDASAYSLHSLRAQIAVVAQQVVLFNDTAENNIAYGVDGPVSREAVVVAAKAANAHDFIAGLEKGYDTVLGEEGVRLSGGERQRIAIARAILRNPSILLLDEATSALDTESEQLIQEALDPLMKGRTTIVVAHRLSTVRNADLILVLDGGCIVERGTHEVLMERNSLYKRLYEMQFASEDAPLAGEAANEEAPQDYLLGEKIPVDEGRAPRP